MNVRKPTLTFQRASQGGSAGPVATDILAVFSKRFLPVRVTRRVLDEVDQLSAEDADQLGIRVVEVTPEQLMEAAVRGGPSQQDRLCCEEGRTVASIRLNPVGACSAWHAMLVRP